MADLTFFSPLRGSFETVTVTDTAGGTALTPAEFRKNPASGDRNRTRTARAALISVEEAALRYTIDGTAPTTSLGHMAAAGSNIVLEGYDAISNFRAIRTTGTSAVLMVTYFGT